MIDLLLRWFVDSLSQNATQLMRSPTRYKNSYRCSNRSHSFIASLRSTNENVFESGIFHVPGVLDRVRHAEECPGIHQLQKPPGTIYLHRLLSGKFLINFSVLKCIVQCFRCENRVGKFRIWSARLAVVRRLTTIPT